MNNVEDLIDALKKDKNFKQVLSFLKKKNSKASITELQSRIVLLLKKQILIELFETKRKEIDDFFNTEILAKHAAEFKNNPIDYISGSMLKAWTSKDDFCGYTGFYKKRILVMKMLGNRDSEVITSLRDIESLRKTRNIASHDIFEKGSKEKDEEGTECLAIDRPDFFMALEKKWKSFETLKKKLEKISGRLYGQ